MQALIDAGRDKGVARSTSWWEGLIESVRSLFRPPPLRHAVAALRRGNLEAAFGLLREEVTARPRNDESALLFWNVALSCQRAAEAADGMASVILAEAAAEESLEQAANHWTALVGEVPGASLDASVLARLLPLLRQRAEHARGEAARSAAHNLFVDALRRCVNPTHGSLNPALALRIAEEARGVDVEVARSAARIALQSTTLHEAKRARLEELLRALEGGQWPEATAPEAPARPAEAPRAAARPAAPPAARPSAPAKAEKGGVQRRAPARAATAARAARSRAAAPAAAEPEAPAKSRRTVALTQDEIEAASLRLAERMAARSPTPPDLPSPAPPDSESASAPAVPAEVAPASPAEVAPAPSAEAAPAAPSEAAQPILDASELEDVAEPQEKEEPVAILEQEDAVAILEREDASAATVDAGSEALEGADFEFGGAAAAPEAIEDFEIDAVLDEDESDADLEIGPLDGEESGEDFEIGTALEAGGSEEDFEIGAAPPAEASAEDLETAAVLEAEPAESVEIATALEDEEPSPPLEATAIAEEAEPDEAFQIGSADEAEVAAPPDAGRSDLTDAVGEALREATLAAEPSSPALRAIDIVPVEIGADNLVALEVAHAQRTRVDYRAVEAIAAAEVSGLATEPVLVVELVLRARPGRPRSSLRMRCDAFDATSLFPDRSDAGEAVRTMLLELLERTQAVPLPDPDSALALRPQRFETLADFEARILARMPA